VADAKKVALSKPAYVDLAKEKLTRNKPEPLSISAGLPTGSYGLDEQHLRPA
jgi:hypothetical protein